MILMVPSSFRVVVLICVRTPVLGLMGNIDGRRYMASVFLFADRNRSDMAEDAVQISFQALPVCLRGIREATFCVCYR